MTRIRIAEVKRRAREITSVPERWDMWSLLPPRPSWLRRNGVAESAEVAEAWSELREHPALSWVPPMWRSAELPRGAAQHAVSALDKNLTVQIVPGPSRHLQVRLMTGPLKDRPVGDGVDPVTPTISVDPDLTVSAASFEQAVVKLRDAVREAYGPSDVGRVLPEEPKTWSDPVLPRVGRRRPVQSGH